MALVLMLSWLADGVWFILRMISQCLRTSSKCCFLNSADLNTLVFTDSQMCINGTEATSEAYKSCTSEKQCSCEYLNNMGTKYLKSNKSRLHLLNLLNFNALYNLHMIVQVCKQALCFQLKPMI